MMRGTDYRDGYADGFANGYAQGLMASGVSMDQIPGRAGAEIPTLPGSATQPKKRKASAYAKRYGAAYRRIRRKHTLKNGKLRKGWTHKKIVKAAHAAAKRK
jgi:hypothetical protein